MRLVLSDHQGMPYQLPQACPHCPEYPDWTGLEDHIAAAHSDLPACTATLTAEYTGGTVRCAFRVGHRSEDFGDWHASKSVWPAGRTVWNDGVPGAVPHGDGR
jgi:hypothetical protein